MLDTPILFMVFNRPQETSRVLIRILDAKPRRLFVSADGPRPDNTEDLVRCNSVRSLFKSIPPEIEVQTLFRESNAGCKRSGIAAFQWFFSNVEKGIILEDDCLPDPSFFGFCEAALKRYENDEKIMIVSGHNPFGAYPPLTDALLSKYPFIWGWASWRRAWKYYQPEIGKWESAITGHQLKSWLKSKHSEYFWRKAFNDTANGSEVWDFQLNYAMYMNEKLAVVSGRNLVSNIGFGANAVHTRDPQDKRQSLPVYTAPTAPLFPDSIAPDARFERKAIRQLYFNHDFTIIGRIKTALRPIRRILRSGERR